MLRQPVWIYHRDHSYDFVHQSLACRWKANGKSLIEWPVLLSKLLRAIKAVKYMISNTWCQMKRFFEKPNKLLETMSTNAKEHITLIFSNLTNLPPEPICICTSSTTTIKSWKWKRCWLWSIRTSTIWTSSTRTSTCCWARWVDQSDPKWFSWSRLSRSST